MSGAAHELPPNALPARTPRATSTLAICALVTLVGLAVSLLIGDFGVRLAASTSDDSPALFARFLLDPSRFEGDIIETSGAAYGLGTFVHWGPALLLWAVDIAPETSALVLAYAQNILLAVSIWLLARAAGQSRSTAWIAAVFTLSAEVYLWNLANYRSQMQIPYAGHLVLPFIAFAAAALLRDAFAWACAALVAAALIHPTVTLLSLPAIAAMILWPLTAIRETHVVRSALLRAASVTVPAAAAALGVALSLRIALPPTLSSTEMLAVMRANVHMNTFATGQFWFPMLTVFSAFLVLLALAIRTRPLPSGYRVLLLTSVILTAVYTLIHAGALQAGWISGISLVPARFSMVLVVLAMPAIAALLVAAIQNGNVAARFSAVALIVLHSLNTVAVYWPAVVSLALATNLTGTTREQPDGNTARPGASVPAGLLAAWIVAAVILNVQQAAGPLLTRAAGLFVLGAPVDRAELLSGLIVAACVCALPGFARRGEPVHATPASGILAVRAMLVVAAGLLLLRDARKGRIALDGEDRDLYEAQHWASRNSAEDAVFIIEPNVPWRVVSQRRAAPLWPTDAHVYTGSRAAYEYTQAVRAQVTRNPFRQEGDVLAFRRRFSGDYLVRWSERAPLFTPVYRNRSFAIYRLPPRSATDALQ